jgi:hypothetical protein
MLRSQRRKFRPMTSLITKRRSRPSLIDRPQRAHYDAFLSYSRQADEEFATAFHLTVERFGRPWNKPRLLHVFRDKASLHASPSLKTALEGALLRSDWLILLASPAAAASPYVNQEIRWWIEHRSTDHMLFVLTDGEFRLRAEASDADTHHSPAVPPALKEILAENPLWVDARWARASSPIDQDDPRLLDNAADIVSAIRGVSKDEIHGSAVREARRTKRLTRGAIAALSTFLVAAIIASVLAVVNLHTAQAETRVALSHVLSATAENEISRNIQRAQLFGVSGLHMEDNGAARNAVFHTVTSSPSLVRSITMPSLVTAMEVIPGTSQMLSGTSDGSLSVIDYASWKRESVQPPSPGKINSIDSSADGETVVATSDHEIYVWQRVSNQIQAISHSGPLGAIAVSPSGTKIAVLGDQPQADGLWPIEIFQHGLQSPPQTSEIAAGGDSRLEFHSEEALQITQYTGRSEYFTGTTLQNIVDTGVQLSPTEGFANGYSPDGKFYGYISAGQVSIWNTSTATPTRPTATARFANPLNSVQAFAISPDARRVAVANSGSIFVSGTTLDDNNIGDQFVLTGNDSVNVSGLTFLDGSDQLVSANLDTLSFWDLKSSGPIVRTYLHPLPDGPRYAPPPVVEISPNDEKIAVVDGSSENVTIYDRRNLASYTVIGGLGAGYPVWSSDSRRLFLIGSSGGQVNRVFDMTGAQPQKMTDWPQTNGVSQILESRLSTDGRTILSVDRNGGLQQRRVSDGVVTAQIADGGGLTGNSPGDGWVALDADRGVAATVDGSNSAQPRLVITSLGDQHSTTLPENNISDVHFSDGRLVVARRNGSIEFRDASGQIVQRTVLGSNSDEGSLSVDYQDAMFTRINGDGLLAIRHLATGSLITEYKLPVPANPVAEVPWAASSQELTHSGQHLIIAVSGGLLTELDLSPNDWAQAACQRAGRNLTQAEWTDATGTSAEFDTACVGQ